MEIQIALLPTLLQQVTNGVAFVGSDLVIRAAHDPDTGGFAHPIEPLVGRPVEALLGVEREVAERILHAVRTTGEAFRGDADPMFAPADRPPGWAKLSIAPVQGEGGTFLGFLVVHERPSDAARSPPPDPPGESQAPAQRGRPAELPVPATPGEAALREQFEQLSTIFDSMQGLLYVADMETYELLYMNAYGESLFGTEAIGEPCYRVLQTGQSGRCAFCTNDRLVGDDGPLPAHVWEFQNTVTGRWFQCIDRAIRWTDGRLVRMEVAVDISESKRIEELLRGTNQMLQAVIDASPLAIVTMDLESRVTRWNRAAERIFGWTAEDVLGRVYPLVDEESREEFTGIQERLWRGETLTGFETRLRKKDGSEIDVSLSTAAIRDAADRITGSMALIADITERRRAEEFRRHYIHTISHDLRNPLMAILGHAELMLIPPRSDGLGEPQRGSLAAIIRATNRMNLMIQDLVDSARLEGGQIELERQPVDVGRFVADLLEQSRTVLDVGRIELSIPPGLPFADADPERLERIVMNLLSNALKYSPPDTAVRVSAAPADGEIAVSIADEGRGIDPLDQPRIFERYYRTRGGRESGGVGLGLYITRMLVEAHGGRISVASEPGTGSTFSFTLSAFREPPGK